MEEPLNLSSKPRPKEERLKAPLEEKASVESNASGGAHSLGSPEWEGTESSESMEEPLNLSSKPRPKEERLKAPLEEKASVESNASGGAHSLGSPEWEGTESSESMEEPLNLSSKPRPKEERLKAPLEEKASVESNASGGGRESPGERAPREKNLIQELLDNDRLVDFIHLKGLRNENEGEPCQRLSRIGDEIVGRLVDWTKHLPFYSELPLPVHTQLLSRQWAELVLLSTAFYATHHLPPLHRDSNPPQPDVSGPVSPVSSTQGEDEPSLSLTNPERNLALLCSRLRIVMRKAIPSEHVRREAGALVTRFTELLSSFHALGLTLEAYVCLKAITLLHAEPGDLAGFAPKVGMIQDQFVKALQIHLSQSEDSARLTDILTWLPFLRSAATVLLQSKMFYVPFLMVTAGGLKGPEAAHIKAPLRISPIKPKAEEEETEAASNSSSSGIDCPSATPPHTPPQ